MQTSMKPARAWTALLTRTMEFMDHLSPAPGREPSGCNHVVRASPRIPHQESRHRLPARLEKHRDDLFKPRVLLLGARLGEGCAHDQPAMDWEPLQRPQRPQPRDAAALPHRALYAVPMAAFRQLRASKITTASPRHPAGLHGSQERLRDPLFQLSTTFPCRQASAATTQDAIDAAVMGGGDRVRSRHGFDRKQG